MRAALVLLVLGSSVLAVFAAPLPSTLDADVGAGSMSRRQASAPIIDDDDVDTAMGVSAVVGIGGGTAHVVGKGMDKYAAFKAKIASAKAPTPGPPPPADTPAPPAADAPLTDRPPAYNPALNQHGTPHFKAGDPLHKVDKDLGFTGEDSVATELLDDAEALNPGTMFAGSGELATLTEAGAKVLNDALAAEVLHL